MISYLIFTSKSFSSCFLLCLDPTLDKHFLKLVVPTEQAATPTTQGFM